MNKKEAIAYAQITLDYMQSSKYKGDITPKTFAIEMNQAFKLYSKDLALIVAGSLFYANTKLQQLKNVEKYDKY